MAAWWWHGRTLDVRWRMWVLVQCATQCAALPGSFVEFGVYRAGCAFMILTLAGLDWLSARGLGTAMLYVEADNVPARTMYEQLGFTIHHAKRWWGLDLPVA